MLLFGIVTIYYTMLSCRNQVKSVDGRLEGQKKKRLADSNSFLYIFGSVPLPYAVCGLSGAQLLTQTFLLKDIFHPYQAE